MAELLSIVGRKLKDEYGRDLGRVISFRTTRSGEVRDFLVSANGDYVYYPRERIKVGEEGEPVLLSDVKLKADSICSQLILVCRKSSVLEKLLKEERVHNETYKEFHETFESEKGRLRREAEETIGEIERLEKDLYERYLKLHSIKTYIEIEYAVGRIGEEAYKLSMREVVKELDSVMREREDLEKTRKWLTNILLGEEAEKESPIAVKIA